MAAIVTTLVVLALLFCVCPCCIGFGLAGVTGGSCAACAQSALYGAYTPAGGCFAACTSCSPANPFTIPITPRPATEALKNMVHRM